MKSRIACYVCLAVVAGAQAPPAFEAASIKPTHYQGGPLRVTSRVDADGINFSNTTLKACIQRAYGVKPYQVTGPDWIGTERYNIVAKASGPAPEAALLLMLQTLLADRFKLVFHRESKEMPVYALVGAKNGPKFKEAKGEGATQIGAGDGEGVLFERAGMNALAGVLARSVDRPVLNDTGLNGLYDFKLTWTEDNGPRRPDAAEPGDAPSIFTAVQEQLGLKLEARRAPVDILVIDRAGRPSEN
jgi:uncharacterized protein (TIGR03435 family)